MSKKILLIIVLAVTLLTACEGSSDRPPLVYLVSNGDLVDGFQSSYCWEVDLESEVCVDTVEPYFDETTHLPANAPIRLQFDTPLPAEVTISISKEVFGETIFSESVPASDFIDWSPAVAPGEYIIDVHTSWKQGDVSYWFSVALE